jgi:hypothetical protein
MSDSHLADKVEGSIAVELRSNADSSYQLVPCITSSITASNFSIF